MIISIDERRRRALRREALRLGISASEFVRRSLDVQLGLETPTTAKEAYLSLVGLGQGDGCEVARRHHQALREVLGRGRFR